MTEVNSIRRQTAGAVCLLVFLYIIPCSAQPDTVWTRDYGNCARYFTMIRTSDGGLALGGEGNSERVEVDGGDFMLIKFDSLANLEWRQFYTVRQPITDQGFAVVQLEDGGYIVGGRTSTDGCVLARTDDDGDSLWMVIYDDEEIPSPPNGGLAFWPTEDGDFVLVTKTVFAKIDENNGDIIWRREFERASYISSIVSAPDGGFILSGNTYEFGAGSADIYIAKTDSEGDLEWEEAYGTEAAEGASSIISVSGGGYCVAGNQRVAQGGLGIHPFMISIDEQGNLLWMQNYADMRGYNLRDVVETPDGGFTACGFSAYYILLRIDYAGEILWIGEYGNYPGNRRITGWANNVFLEEDGGYLLGGFVSGIGLWLVRTEPDPVDFAFELEAEADSVAFGEVEIDSVETWEIPFANTGRRYVIIDSLWIEGDSVFAFAMDLPFRIEPEDTAYVPILFQPKGDTTYTATLHLHYGDEQTVEVVLSGRGVEPDGVEKTSILPIEFSLSAYPNPFNNVTTIRNSLPIASTVVLQIFDLQGKELAQLVNGNIQAGNHTVAWDATGLPSGIYFARLEAGSFVKVNKLTLIR